MKYLLNQFKLLNQVETVEACSNTLNQLTLFKPV